MKLTDKERRALREYQKPLSNRDTHSIHANTRHALIRKKLLSRGSHCSLGYQPTKLGHAELKIPDIFDDLFRGSKS